MKQNSGRGGKREGSGRKAGEGSKMVRVPLGCLDAVQRLIADYKAGNQTEGALSSEVPHGAGAGKPDCPSVTSPALGLALPHEFVALNQSALQKLTAHLGEDDLREVYGLMLGETSGQFLKSWDRLPKSTKLKAVKKHKTISGVYQAGGRVLPEIHPMVPPLLFWLVR